MKIHFLLTLITIGVFNSSAQLTIDDSQLLSVINKQLDTFESEKKLPSREDFYKTSSIKVELKNGEALGEGYEKQVRGALVLIRAYKSKILPGWQISLGAAVPVGKNLILTNYHLIDPKKRGDVFMIMDFEGKCSVVKNVKKFSSENDLAILECDSDNLVKVKISTDNQVGKDVAIVSHPDNQFFTYTKGYITRHFSEALDGAKYHKMSVSAEFAKGSSGAPVLSSKGELLGLVSLTRSIYYNKKNGIDQNLQMVQRVCIPSQVILKFLKD